MARRYAVLGLTGLALAGVAWSMTTEVRPFLVYNASPSASLGFYRLVDNDPPQPGDIVLAPPPVDFQSLIDQRGYLSPRTPLIKRVVAVARDHVCRHRDAILINGRTVIEHVHGRDSLGRTLPSWHGCRRLRSGEIFALMSDAPNSLDSRYFGPIETETIIGTLVPLWTF